MALLMAGYWSRGGSFYNVQQMDEAGGEVAAVTHKHPLAFLPSAMLTHLIYSVIRMKENEFFVFGSNLEGAHGVDTIKPYVDEFIRFAKEYSRFTSKKGKTCPCLLHKTVVIQNINYNFVVEIQNGNLK